MTGPYAQQELGGPSSGPPAGIYAAGCLTMLPAARFQGDFMVSASRSWMSCAAILFPAVPAMTETAAVPFST